MNRFELYTNSACPFCKKVELYMDTNDIKVLKLYPKLQAMARKNWEEYAERLGSQKPTTPLLHDREAGKVIMDSSEIIIYLNTIK